MLATLLTKRRETSNIALIMSFYFAQQ